MSMQGRTSNTRGPDDDYVPTAKRRKVAPVSKKPQKQTDESPFPLLKLPGEIRNMIYQYALTAVDGKIYIQRGRDEGELTRNKPMRMAFGSRKKKFNDVALQLLRVNKQVHKEATPLLYSQNTFSFECMGDLSSFLGRHSLHVRDLTNIVIRDSVRPNQGATVQHHGEMAFSLLAFAENLEHFEVTIELIGRGDNTIEQSVGVFFRLARNWLQAVGSREGDKLAAMNILTIHCFESHTRRQLADDDQLHILFLETLKQILAG